MNHVHRHCNIHICFANEYLSLYLAYFMWYDYGQTKTHFTNKLMYVITRMQAYVHGCVSVCVCMCVFVLADILSKECNRGTSQMNSISSRTYRPEIISAWFWLLGICRDARLLSGMNCSLLPSSPIVLRMWVSRCMRA